jgi:hypothetical protein
MLQLLLTAGANVLMKVSINAIQLRWKARMYGGPKERILIVFALPSESLGMGWSPAQNWKRGGVTSAIFVFCACRLKREETEESRLLPVYVAQKCE